jgi:hypothetical protein
MESSQPILTGISPQIETETTSTQTDTRTTIDREEENDEEVEPQAIAHDSETGEAILIERSRSNFAYTENELRQRNVINKETIKPAPTKTTTSVTDNYKDDANYNGGGFYECNIW